jgi:hypothetical protein
VTFCEYLPRSHISSLLLNHPPSATGWYCFSHFVVVLNHQYVDEKVFGIKFQVFQKKKTNVKIKYHQNILLASLIIHHNPLSFPSSPSSQTQTQSSKNPIQKKEKIKNQAATPQAPPNPPSPTKKTTENRKRQQLLKLNGKKTVTNTQHKSHKHKQESKPLTRGTTRQKNKNKYYNTITNPPSSPKGNPETNKKKTPQMQARQEDRTIYTLSRRCARNSIRTKKKKTEIKHRRPNQPPHQPTSQRPP